jgi:predicted deacylase
MNTLTDIRACLRAYPIEVHFPDISRWSSGNAGIDYLHTFDSGNEGPHVMISSLVHGNEVSGAIALDTLLDSGLRPRKGRLSFCFANVEAYQRFDKDDADAGRYVDEDLNRIWSETKLEGTADSVELRRAREIRPFIDTVDLLLDIHSMHEESEPLMMSGPLVNSITLRLNSAFQSTSSLIRGMRAAGACAIMAASAIPRATRMLCLLKPASIFPTAAARLRSI